MSACVNVHGTAIVFGTWGLLFVGPSGSGKTMLALSMVEAMTATGRHAGLVSDDQVMVREANGRAVARAPASILGLAEIRGTGIISIETVAAVVLDVAIQLVKAPIETRLPPPDERFDLGIGMSLPLLRLAWGDGIDSFANLRRILHQNLQV